tara:strand:- start:173 stop:1120 length:948 start_codon:yes stop_codon:yes gene_type:complete
MTTLATQTAYTLQIELGLAQQQLHSICTDATSIFTDQIFCGFDLDGSNNNKTNAISATDATTFHGFIKIQGCAIIEASTTLPNFNKKSGSVTKFTRDEAPPLVIPQLVTARQITKAAVKRLSSWLDLNGRIVALSLEASENEMLGLRSEIEAARNELLGIRLPLFGNKDQPRRHRRTQHCFHSQLPNNLIMEIGIQNAEFCLYVWTVAPLLRNSVRSNTPGNKLVENVQNIIARTFSGREDAELRNIISSTSNKSDRCSGTGGNVGNLMITQFSKCSFPFEPCKKMLTLLNKALRICDQMLQTLSSLASIQQKRN